ncbi:hypothetical protein PIB30_004709 [Stylosanthes scabra]|uniref:Non-haem dioxygenase N-terminal domain-containing protein n=1 Tax=Stylosanthes scabra TaxID=79078 RepID=A0ABU6R2P2_9FABA|nr:hypothetical protein [Stylosanthes scabra]
MTIILWRRQSVLRSYVVEDCIVVVEGVLLSSPALRGGLKRREGWFDDGVIDAFTQVRVFYRNTVATGRYARSLAFNPNKMKVFNGVFLEKLKQASIVSGVIDNFDMTFPWHFVIRCNNGVHYGRAPRKMKWRDGQIGQQYFVDLMLAHVPVIDMVKLLSQHHKEPELQKLHYACKDWGFFQLINHGVNTSLLESMKKGSQDFFNQPIEEKKKRFGQLDGDVQGYGQAFVVSMNINLSLMSLSMFVVV